MLRLLLPALLLLLAAPAYCQLQLPTVFETSAGTATATYEEGMAWWYQLQQAYPQQVAVVEVGETDSGPRYPLHVVMVTAKGVDASQAYNADDGLLTVLINNAIHPGEPDGVEASMMLARDLLNGTLPAKMLKGVKLAIVPFYNIGGTLNRNSTTRVNQAGPDSYGFRGNARNYDLNRDFVKQDTHNARSFARLFHTLKPHIFVDTHTSNGADYQYVLTILATQHNKLGSVQGEYLENTMLPQLYRAMDKEKVLTTPYVNVWGSVPDSGIVQFFDSPRYSTGYATLFQTIGFMTETHMLKPFKQRVVGTYAFLKAVVAFGQKEQKDVIALRLKAKTDWQNIKTYDLLWQANRNVADTLLFKGYTANIQKSEVTGLDRLFYDQTKPFTKAIPFYNTYESKLSVQVPEAYIIPAQWRHIVDLLKLNGVAVVDLPKDYSANVESYRIVDFETRGNAYEGHYLHYNTQVVSQKEEKTFRAGAFIVYTQQNELRYIMEVLEPQGQDSFFNWNYFDTILQRKEGFSPYVFEDLAKELLANDAALRAAFEEKRNKDASFAQSSYQQLQFIYRHSPHYEAAHLQNPIYRVLAK